MLLDLGLPDISGLEVCRRVRAGGYAGPVLVITARTSLGDVTASVLAGANDFLGKPFGLTELRNRVNDALTCNNSYRPRRARADHTGIHETACPSPPPDPSRIRP